MTPVVNPWVFYLMSLADCIKVVGLVAGGVVGLIWLLMAAFAWVDREFPEYCKHTRAISTIAIIAITLGMLAPSQSTIAKMIVAKNVTYERVEVAADAVQTVYEDIMEMFAEEE